MYEWLHRKLKLAHHSQSGRLLPHKHTSNGALVVIVLFSGVMLGLATRGLVVSADTVESGSVSLNGQVPAPPPNQAAVIQQPGEGQSFTDSPITVSGTCESGNFVEVYKNDVLGGSTTCVGGQFELKLDLIDGANALKARTLDNLHQYGPDSAIVDVNYKPPAAPAANPALPASPVPPQLIITTDSAYFGVTAHNPYSLNLIIAGGQSPYAVSVNWGDGQQDLVSRSSDGRFSLSHTYASGDIYYLTISASDAAGDKAYTQTTLLVGAAAGGSLAAGQSQGPGASASVRSAMDVIWPLYVGVLVAVSTFWLGEKYQRRKINDLWKTSKS